MPFEVVLTEDAARDLEGITRYVAEFDSPKKAGALLDRLSDLIESLEQSPERGAQPKELRSVGIADYRQLFFKPYRVIYRVIDRRVIIYIVADGRRDMQTLLSQRLLRS